MKRSDLIDGITDLIYSDDVDSSLGELVSFAMDFCNNYESEFNDIKDCLDALALHIDSVKEAHKIAEKCANDLY